ncbi:MAG: glutamate-5-semialdehyde dehydrogenase [Propionibacteriaceae bacterium]|jgi:glutamate-5-semialdehyde dehydrogenase|nr:glutamate-5-semialdehyde dehydrogenase [Propionibacteriaceae bacterium]
MTTFTDQARAALLASHSLALLTSAEKNRALLAMADALAERSADILEANGDDVERARGENMTSSLLDRLTLTGERIAAMAEGLRELAGLADPVGEIVRGWVTADDLHIEEVRTPIGVIGIIYEARPNVTADAAGICFKAGNAALLRGSSSAVSSNRAIVKALRHGLAAADLPAECVDAVALVEGDREVTTEMMQARGLVDLLIPRGGAGLIEAVVRGSQVPVIETGTGNCHLYVDAAADLDLASEIIINAKTSRPSVCNALETLLVDAAVAELYVPRIVQRLIDAGVTVHGDDASRRLDSRIVEARADEFDAEYLSLDLALSIVEGIDAAIAHIRRHSSGHSETIVTNDLAHARRFTSAVDAAAVLVNASSRFVDGGCFGFGAEIGISTQKLHARGPMGLREMTTTKYIVQGTGQIRI